MPNTTCQLFIFSHFNFPLVAFGQICTKNPRKQSIEIPAKDAKKHLIFTLSSKTFCIILSPSCNAGLFHQGYMVANKMPKHLSKAVKPYRVSIPTCNPEKITQFKSKVCNCIIAVCD
jgi:hypothetical protein